MLNKKIEQAGSCSIFLFTWDLREGVLSGNSLANDERVDVVRALIGVD